MVKNLHTANVRNKLSPLQLVIDLLTNKDSKVTLEFIQEVAKQGKTSILGILKELDGIEAHGNEVIENPLIEKATDRILPTNLEDVLIDIMRTATPESCTKFKNVPEDMCGDGGYVFNGRAMRNNYDLWIKSDITKWFAERNVFYADDSCVIIFRALWYKLNGKEYDMEPDVKRFQAHWDSLNHDIKKEYNERNI